MWVGQATIQFLLPKLLCKFNETANGFGTFVQTDSAAASELGYAPQDHWVNGCQVCNPGQWTFTYGATWTEMTVSSSLIPPMLWSVARSALAVSMSGTLRIYIFFNCLHPAKCGWNDFFAANCLSGFTGRVSYLLFILTRFPKTRPIYHYTSLYSIPLQSLCLFSILISSSPKEIGIVASFPVRTLSAGYLCCSMDWRLSYQLHSTASPLIVTRCLCSCMQASSLYTIVWI